MRMETVLRMRDWCEGHLPQVLVTGVIAIAVLIIVRAFWRSVGHRLFLFGSSAVFGAWSLYFAACAALGYLSGYPGAVLLYGVFGALLAFVSLSVFLLGRIARDMS